MAGLALGATGIAMAWQLRKTRSAVEAASAAIRRAQRGSSRNQLLVLLERLINIEGELRTAVSAKDEEAAGTALRSWRLCASETHSIIHDLKPDWGDLFQLLGQSLRASGAMRPAQREGADVPRRYTSVLVAIQHATTEISGRATELRAYTEGTDGNVS